MFVCTVWLHDSQKYPKKAQWQEVRYRMPSRCEHVEGAIDTKWQLANIVAEKKESAMAGGQKRIQTCGSIAAVKALCARRTSRNGHSLQWLSLADAFSCASGFSVMPRSPPTSPAGTLPLVATLFGCSHVATRAPNTLTAPLSCKAQPLRSRRARFGAACKACASDCASAAVNAMCASARLVNARQRLHGATSCGHGACEPTSGLTSAAASTLLLLLLCDRVGRSVRSHCEIAASGIQRNALRRRRRLPRIPRRQAPAAQSTFARLLIRIVSRARARVSAVSCSGPCCLTASRSARSSLPPPRKEKRICPVPDMVKWARRMVAVAEPSDVEHSQVREVTRGAQQPLLRAVMHPQAPRAQHLHLLASSLHCKNLSCATWVRRGK